MNNYIKRANCQLCEHMKLNTAQETCSCAFFHEDLSENVVECSAFKEKNSSNNNDMKKYEVKVTPLFKEETITVEGISKEDAILKALDFACNKYSCNLVSYLKAEVEHE